MPMISTRITPCADAPHGREPSLKTTPPVLSFLHAGSLRHVDEDSDNCSFLLAETRAAGPVIGLATCNGLLYSICLTDASSLEAWAELGLTAQILPAPTNARPPVSAVAVGGSNWMATAHKDLKIRLWRLSAATGQLEHVATLPTLRQFMHNLTLQHRYEQTRRHGKKRAWMQHSDIIRVLAFSADCTLLYSASWDRSVKVWSLQVASNYLKCEDSFPAHTDSINAMLVGAADGLLYTGSADMSIKVWSRQATSTVEACGVRQSVKCKHSMVVELQDQGSAVNALVLSCDGSLLYSGGSDGRVLVWRKSSTTWPHVKAESADQLLVVHEKLRGHARAVLCLDLLESDDGGNMSRLLVSGSADRTIRVWRQRRQHVCLSRTKSGTEHQLQHECLAVLRGHTAPVRSLRVCIVEELRGVCAGVAFSGGLDGSIKMWMLSTAKTASAQAADEDDQEAGRAILLI